MVLNAVRLLWGSKNVHYQGRFDVKKILRKSSTDSRCSTFMTTFFTICDIWVSSLTKSKPASCKSFYSHINRLIHKKRTMRLLWIIIIRTCIFFQLSSTYVHGKMLHEYNSSQHTCYYIRLREKGNWYSVETNTMAMFFRWTNKNYNPQAQLIQNNQRIQESSKSSPMQDSDLCETLQIAALVIL